MESQETRFWHRIATIVGITLGLVVVAGPAWAGDTYRFKGKSAEAYFFSTDPSGCVSTDVYVFASDDASVSHDPPGPPNSSSGSVAYAGIFQYDYCQYTYLYADCYNSAPLAASDFVVTGRNLDSATLNTTLQCYDYYSGGSFDAPIALVWTAVGDPQSSSYSSHYRTAGFIVHDRFTGTYRNAEASGSVSDFTPNPSSYAVITNAKSGSVVID